MDSAKDKRLTTKDLEFLRKHTNYDEDTIQRMYGEFKNNCPKRRLSPKNFASVYNLFFPDNEMQRNFGNYQTGNVDQFCDYVFKAFDTDKNGYIDVKEFFMACSFTAGATAEEKLKMAFSMYDVDGNGFIDQNEMAKIIHAVAILKDPECTLTDVSVLEGKAKVLIESLDLSRDGRLSEEEFVTMCLQNDKVAKLFAPHLIH